MRRLQYLQKLATAPIHLRCLDASPDANSFAAHRITLQDPARSLHGLEHGCLRHVLRKCEQTVQSPTP